MAAILLLQKTMLLPQHEWKPLGMISAEEKHKILNHFDSDSVNLDSKVCQIPEFRIYTMSES